MDKKVTFQAQLPVIQDVDVLVVGGGTAGLCAAVAASRAGASTMLIEQGGCCGGMATQALVGPFMTCYDALGEEMIIKGLFEEVVDRLVAKGGAIHPSKVKAGTAFTSYIVVGHQHVTPFDAEVLKQVMDEMLLEANVEALYHAQLIQPIMAGSTVTGAIVACKSGVKAISCKVMVDCTGDGDAAVRAGAPYELGDEASGRIQPASMFFRIGNVDSDRVDQEIAEHQDDFYRKDGVNYRSLHWRIAEARENGDWNLNRVSIGMFRGVRKDEWSINTSRIMHVDGTDSASLTRAEMEGRKQVAQIFQFFKKYVPGCENAVLLSSASRVGIRETRHIKGEYVLQVEDVVNANVPKDSIAMAANSIDVHGRFGAVSNEYTPVTGGRYYGVPYRCLVPLKVDGLLVAGRCISATSDAAGAIRVMPPCMATGQAAGIAAALSVKSGEAPRSLNVDTLIEALKEQKAFLEMPQ